ncbi:MAG: trypsin-like peptidase domain-containing protein [Pirellulaceae bacterium]
MHNTKCPHCSVRLLLDDKLVGRSVKCPKCRGTFMASIQATSPPPRAVSPPQRNSQVSSSGDVDSSDNSPYGPADVDQSDSDKEQLSLMIVLGVAVAMLVLVVAAIGAARLGRTRPNMAAVSENEEKDIAEQFITSLPSASPPQESADASRVDQSTIAPSKVASSQAPVTVLQPAASRTERLPSTEPVAVDMEQLIERVEPSVVRIDVRGRDGEYIGSGFVIDNNGTIATNAHVISDAVAASVEFRDGRRFPLEVLLFVDEARDIALLKADLGDYSPRSLPLANERPKKGTTVIAFGSPKGLDGSVSDGIVAATREGSELSRFLESLGQEGGLEGTWIQTTAPVSPGNSGGPLVDMQGRVVGLNTLASGSSLQNLNFAISSLDLHVALLASKQATPIALRDRQVPPSSAAELPTLEEDSVAVLAVINEELSATMQNDLAARLRSLRTNLASSPTDTAWVLVAFYDQEIQPGANMCQVNLVLFRRHITNDGRIAPRVTWETSFTCSGPSITKSYNSNVTNALQEFMKNHRQFRQ